MTRRRTLHRSLTAIFAVVVLLFSQLAMASYACPAQADVNQMAEMAAAGTPRGEMDAAQPALCHERAADAAQSFEAVKAPTPSLPAVLQVVVLPLILKPTGWDMVVRVAFAEVRPPPDPLFLTTLRLRV